MYKIILEYAHIDTLLQEKKSHFLLLFVYDSREVFSQIAGQMMLSFIEDEGCLELRDFDLRIAIRERCTRLISCG